MSTLKVAFLDRDGVIFDSVAEHDYVLRCEQAKYTYKSEDSIKLLNDMGYKVIVVTNQRCVALGKINIRELNFLHDKMKKHVYEISRGIIDDVYVCPHEISKCNCRKPRTGLLEMANSKYNLDKSVSWIIGDRNSDIQCGKNFGISTIAINNPSLNADLHAKNLWEAVNKLRYFKESKKID